MNRPGIYIIILFLGASLCYSQIPPSHQFLLHYPTLGLVRILSSRPVLKFAFPHIWPPQLKFCFSAIIDVRPWDQPSLFYQDLVRGDSDLSFLQQSLPRGLQVGMVVLLWFMAGLLTENGCSLWLSPFRHLVLISPTTSFCHSKHYLPFSAMPRLLWRDV